MATKRRKVRKSRKRSCKNGKLKRVVRTKKGGKRRCKKTKKRKTKKRNTKKRNTKKRKTKKRKSKNKLIKKKYKRKYKMITRSMSKKLDKKYNMRVRPNNDNAIQRERRENFKRIPVEIYSGFLMQLVGDQLVNSDGSQSNLLRMLNEKYNKEINATCSDRQTYYDLRAERINNPFKDQIVSHSFDGDTCTHFVYYDTHGNSYDSYTGCRQREMGHQFCQNHSLVMAYRPDLRNLVLTKDSIFEELVRYAGDTNLAKFLIGLDHLYNFWNENLIDILTITSQTDFDQNILNLRITNKSEDEHPIFKSELYEFGEHVIDQIESLIRNKSFFQLKTAIFGSLFGDTNNVLMMAEW